jgi:hypothetical protein
MSRHSRARRHRDVPGSVFDAIPQLPTRLRGVELREALRQFGLVDRVAPGESPSPRATFHPYADGYRR